METTRSTSVRLFASQIAAVFTVFIHLRYLLIALILLFFGSVLMVLASVSMFYLRGYPDTFAAYGDIMPGQPLSSLEQYRCTFHVIESTNSNLGYCQSELSSGLVLTIHSLNNAISSLSFQQTDWHFGDLVERWGYPNVVRKLGGFAFQGWSKEFILVRWSRQYAYAVLAPLSRDGVLNYRLPV